MWVKFTETEPEVYNFFFYSKESMEDLVKVVSKSQYESNSRSNFEELKEEDQKWIYDALEDFNDNEFEEGKDVIMDYDNKFQEEESDVKNKLSTQAYLHDRTFVVKENNIIGVYKTDEQDSLTVFL